MEEKNLFILIKTDRINCRIRNSALKTNIKVFNFRYFGIVSAENYDLRMLTSTQNISPKYLV
jgi:hypothetical protein